MARRGRHRRAPRHRGATVFLVLLSVGASSVLGIGLLRHGAPTRALGETPTAAARFLGNVATTTSSTTTTTVPDRNPLASPEMQSLLKGRKGVITAAVYDVATEKTYVANPGTYEVAASMVKSDILAALLYKAQVEHRSLTKQEDSLARTMILNSDNDAAQTLYHEIGERDGLMRFDAQLGFETTKPDWGWGNWQITPTDELTLLKNIALPSAVLSNESQNYARSLMEHIGSTGRFGIAIGPSAGTTVGFKNGWYHETSTGWQLNSAGWVHSGRTFYIAVIETQGSPTEDYGIQTANQFGTLLWQFETMP